MSQENQPRIVIDPLLTIVKLSGHYAPQENGKSFQAPADATTFSYCAAVQFLEMLSAGEWPQPTRAWSDDKINQGVRWPRQRGALKGDGSTRLDGTALELLRNFYNADSPRGSLSSCTSSPKIAREIAVEVARRSDSGMWPAELHKPSRLPGWIGGTFSASITGNFGKLGSPGFLAKSEESAAMRAARGAVLGAGPIARSEDPLPVVLSAVRYTKTGSHPWAIQDEQGNHHAESGYWSDIANIGIVWFPQGAFYFRLKSHAVAAIAEIEKQRRPKG